MQTDKRTGRKQIMWRSVTTKEIALPSLTLKEAIDHVVVLKRARNLKARTIKDDVTNMNYLV